MSPSIGHAFRFRLLSTFRILKVCFLMAPILVGCVPCVRSPLPPDRTMLVMEYADRALREEFDVKYPKDNANRDQIRALWSFYERAKTTESRKELEAQWNSTPHLRENSRFLEKRVFVPMMQDARWGEWQRSEPDVEEPRIVAQFCNELRVFLKSSIVPIARFHAINASSKHFSSAEGRSALAEFYERAKGTQRKEDMVRIWLETPVLSRSKSLLETEVFGPSIASWYLSASEVDETYLVNGTIAGLEEFLFGAHRK